ncbi:MAG: LSm family protein [Candidatus Nanohalobium sp.]
MSDGNNRRPFDVLNEAKDGRILVTLKGYGDEEKQVSGELQAFDKHLNIWLEDARVTSEEGQTDYGQLFVRGDNILFVSPE